MALRRYRRKGEHCDNLPMGDGFLRSMYRRLGRHYARVTLVLEFQLAHVVVLGGLALLTLYQPMSTRQFLVLLVVAECLVAVENTIGWVVAFRMLRPVQAWLDGDRSESSSTTAWAALVELPVTFIKSRKLSPIFLSTIPWCVFAVLYLDLSLASLPMLIGAACVVLLYGVTLRYFTLELGLRPVVEHVATYLPGGEAPAITRIVPLRWKLLAGLPLINIITGVIVAGLSRGGHPHLSDLGADVLIAVGVAFTASFELTVLLSRSILGPLRDLRIATAEVAAGDLSVRVPVVSSDETGQLSQAFNEMVAGLEERERLSEALGAFVDPAIAERVARDGIDLVEGEEVCVSVLFLDIRAFTAFAERAGAAEVVQRLNEFFALVVPILEAHGGHVSKFLGDGLLGVFGAPDRRADHADRAVAASLEILAAVRDRYGDTLGVGIGVNSGPVVAGTIGGGGKLDFTVIGDTVNTASRVEAVTRETGDELLITQATCERLTATGVTWEQRPPIMLRGKRDAVTLFGLADAAGTISARDVRERAAAAD